MNMRKDTALNAMTSRRERKTGKESFPSCHVSGEVVRQRSTGTCLRERLNCVAVPVCSRKLMPVSHPSD